PTRVAVRRLRAAAAAVGDRKGARSIAFSRPKPRHGSCFGIGVLPFIAAGWVIGLAVGGELQTHATVILGVVASASALALGRHGAGLRARLWHPILGVLAFGAGVGVSPDRTPACRATGEVRVEGMVERVRYGPDEADVFIGVIAGRDASDQSIAAGTKLRLRLPFERAPPRGSIVRFDGRLRPGTFLRNASIHPLRTHGREICWARTVGEQGVEVLASSRWRRAIAEVRASVRRRLRAGLPPDVSPIARALVLGDGGALPYEQRRTIASVGLAHLFAVSGMHIALVSGTLVTALGWALRGTTLRIAPSRIAAALGVPLTLLHACIAGGAPSAWRAAITAAITWSLVAMGRRASAPAVTASAAILLSAPDPGLATRPAFWLSIVATSAILGGHRVEDGRWRRLRGASRVSARTLVATAPLVWWWFGGVPLIGWLTNIVVLPLGTLVVIPLAHTYAAFAEVPFVGQTIATGLIHSSRLLVWVCETLAPLAVAQSLPPLSPVQGAAVTLGCVAWLTRSSLRARIAVLIATAAVWGVAEAAIHADRASDSLRVSFIDVGQGDAILVEFPDGSLGVVDTGPGGRHPAAREILRILRERRRTRIDRLIITHGHPDHDGALPALLDAVEIGELWLNGQRLAEETDGRLQGLVERAERSGTRVRFAPSLCGPPHRFGSATLEVVWPCPRYDPALDLNDNSMTLSLRFRGRHILLTGDLESQAEQALLGRGALGRADVLKVAHHGSRTSTTTAFVDTVQPHVAVISAGVGNWYGHPSSDVLARLAAAGATVYRTDLHGGVTVTVDDHSLQVETWSRRRLVLPPRTP
ncbi:MAG: ComEC/Rec2 family competence protein, partial [Myxococcota bacterium]